MARRYLTSIDLNKNEIQNARAHVLAAAPSAPVGGIFYWDSVLLKLYYYNGSAWIATDGTSILGPAPPTTQAIGTAGAAGTAVTSSRSDHVHPMAAAAAPAASAVGDTVVTGVATTFAASDHKHAREAFATPAIVLGTAAAAGVATTPIRSDATLLAFDATVPVTQAIGDAAAVGAATVAARRDHKHAMPAFASPTAETAFGSSSAAGTSVSVPHADHTHGNPTHIGTDHSAIRINDLTTPNADVAWNNNKITGLKDPTAAQDAATKAYVDAVSQGLAPKPSCRVATTGAETFTVAAGTVTVITGTVVDGVSPAIGDRILIKDAPAATGVGSANSTQPGNGIYTVTNATTNLTVARVADMSGAVNLPAGAFTFVEAGTVNLSSGWVVVTPSSAAAFTYGTNNIAWTQFSGAGEITAGTGMSKTGNTLNVGAGATPGSGGPGGGVVVNADDVVIDTTVVVRKFSASVGDGSTLAYVVTHNLNTQDVIVRVRDNSSPFAFMEPDIEATSVNTVTVRFTVAPTTNQYRIICHA